MCCLEHSGTHGIPSSTGGPFPYKSGALYSLDKTQGLRLHLDSIDLSNGIAWTKDNTRMFFIDSLPKKIYSFDFDLARGTVGKVYAFVFDPGRRTCHKV